MIWIWSSPARSQNFCFVSNTEYSNSDAKKSIHLSPIKLSKAVLAAKSKNDLEGSTLDGFEALRDATKQDGDALFSVLQRLELVPGPTERAFEDELCQTHLPTLSQCSVLSAGSLAKVLNSLIGLIERAASLHSNDPLRHYVGLTSTRKWIPISLGSGCALMMLPSRSGMLAISVFNILKGLATLSLDKDQSGSIVLKKKLDRGGLGSRYEVIRRQVLTAESALLDVASRPGGGQQKLAQIENVVLAECDEAHLRTSSHQAPFGPAMLIDVYDRLKAIAVNNPLKVDRQPYEVLVGVAGLLTSECLVWWSEEFEMEDGQ